MKAAQSEDSTSAGRHRNDPNDAGVASDRVQARGKWRDAASALSFSKISGIYVWIALIALFSVWIPDIFLTKTTWIDIAGSQAVTGIITLGLLLPLAAGAYDLSIGSVVGISAVISSTLVHNGMDSTTAIGLALLAGLAIGMINATLIVGVGINSLIATLGMSSILIGLIAAISNNQQIIGLSNGFENIGIAEPLGIPIPVFYFAALAILGWYLFEHTPFGRYLHAIGGGQEAARLAGIKTKSYQAIALVLCSLMAAFAGVVVTAKLGVGSPDVGNAYLLPAFAAAFLGATQIKPGRFNVWGTVIAVYLLATGVKGLQLAGAAYWVTELFNGAVLIIAVGLSQFEGRLSWRRSERRLRKRAAG